MQAAPAPSSVTAWDECSRADSVAEDLRNNGGLHCLSVAGGAQTPDQTHPVAQARGDGRGTVEELHRPRAVPEHRPERPPLGEAQVPGGAQQLVRRHRGRGHDARLRSVPPVTARPEPASSEPIRIDPVADNCGRLVEELPPCLSDASTSVSSLPSRHPPTRPRSVPKPPTRS